MCSWSLMERTVRRDDYGAATCDYGAITSGGVVCRRAGPRGGAGSRIARAGGEAVSVCLQTGAAMLKFGILGPIQLFEGDQRRSVRGPGQVRLLACLLVNANRAVSTDQLVEALWCDEDARAAVKRLHVAIARLRKQLDVDRARTESPLQTAAGGYLLQVAPGDLDADVFR